MSTGRSETIATITAKLASPDDERLQAIAELIEDAETVLPRELTERERALIEQAKADVQERRKLSMDEARAYMDVARASRRAK